MEINSFEMLVDYISRINDKELIGKLLKSYGDKRQELGVKSGWKRATYKFSRQVHHRRDNLRNHITDKDQITGRISIEDFIYFFASIESELERLLKKSLFNKIKEFMYQKVDIVIDRRKAPDYKSIEEADPPVMPEESDHQDK